MGLKRTAYAFIGTLYAFIDKMGDTGNISLHNCARMINELQSILQYITA